MKKTLIIAKKELQNYFFNPAGYVFAGLLLIIVNTLYWNDVFLIGSAQVSPMLTTIAYLFSLFIPVMVMGSIADERKNGTYEVLKTLPITERNIVFGKFGALKAYILLILLMTLPTVIGISLLTNIDWGTVLSGYIGIAMLGMAYGAIGIFMSTLWTQSIVSFLVTSVVLIVNNMMSQDIVLSRLPATLKPIIEGLSLSFRLGRFSNGVININDFVFMISVIAVFLIMAIFVLENSEK